MQEGYSSVRLSKVRFSSFIVCTFTISCLILGERKLQSMKLRGQWKVLYQVFYVQWQELELLHNVYI